MNLPKPLIPSNVDLQDYTYMPLHVLRLRDSEFTSEVSAEAFRAGVLLWCTAWHQVPAGSLPNNDKTLSNMAGYGRVVGEWLKFKEEALRGWILCDDDRWYHPVICEVAMESWVSKQEYNYKKFADRLRKRNLGLKEKNLPLIDIPLIEQWISAGMPNDWGNNSIAINPSEKGISNINPEEFQNTSAGIPTENALKERESNIREENINIKTSLSQNSGEQKSENPNPDDPNDWKPDLGKLNTKLKMAGATPIDQKTLDQTLVVFNPHYESQRLSDNQRLAKLVSWIKSDQQRAAAQPKPAKQQVVEDQEKRQTDTTRTQTTVVSAFEGLELIEFKKLQKIKPEITQQQVRDQAKTRGVDNFQMIGFLIKQQELAV